MFTTKESAVRPFLSCPNPLLYCRFLQIIMLGGIRTGWIFREKADCKQSNEIRPLVLTGSKLKAPSANLYPPDPGPVL